jgi:hypothetical protein
MFAVGVLACAYVSVVLMVGTASVVDWSRRGQIPRAFWVGVATTGMLIPGIVLAGISVWYLHSRRRREAGDVQQGFDVLPPR